MNRLPALALILVASLVVIADARQVPFEDVVRNLRNPDAKARMNAVRALREARHVEAAGPMAVVINDPIEAIQLEAIAAELSFSLIQDLRARRRVGLFIEVRSKGQAARAFELGPLATWPRAAPAEVVSALLKAVDDDSAPVRMEAIYSLGVVARAPLDEQAADSLIAALDHYDPAIRAAAARVIGRLGVGRASDTLIRLINDSNTAVRFAAMRALGSLNEERAVQALTEQFNYYRKGEGAWSALDALAKIAHASSVPLFTAQLANKDPYLRRAAAEGLGRSRDATQLAAIQGAASTDDAPMVRAAMTFAMVRLGQNYQARLTEFLASERTSRQVQDYLLEIGPPAIPGLSSSLADPSPEVRAQVAELLGALGNADTIALLQPLTSDRDRLVSDAATTAIARLKATPQRR